MSLLVASPTAAQTEEGQDQDEPAFEQLVEQLKSRQFNLGLLIQAVGQLAEGGDPFVRDGFSLAAARVLLHGELDGGWRYFLQADFSRPRVLLDARVGYVTPWGIRIDAGRFKVPVSHEFLTYAGSIDFVNRSRVVALVSPGRQIGVQVGMGRPTGLTWSAGAFSGPDNLGSADAYLVAGRLSSTFSGVLGPGGTLIVGGNGGYGQNEALARGLLLADYLEDEDPFVGEGWVVGVDLRYAIGRALLSAEVLGNHLDADDGSLDAGAWGLHVTTGWLWTPKHQTLVRWDRFNGLAGQADDALLLGWNWWPTRASELQLNYVIPVAGDGSLHQLLVNLQLGF